MLVEVASAATVDVTALARKVIADIGYTDPSLGFTADSCLVFTNIHQQSTDIQQGVTQAEGDRIVGSGDRESWHWPVTNDAELYALDGQPGPGHSMPTHTTGQRGDTALGQFLRPDGKSQVMMRFDEDGRPIGIHSLILSAQHSEAIDQDDLRRLLQENGHQPGTQPWMH